MVGITYIEADGTRHALDVAATGSVMEAAMNNGVPGIDADCGGACSCATCHVIVDPAWADRVGPAEGIEADLLEMVADLRSTSRLSCQLAVTPDLDGLVVHLPEQQG